jgi:hypothetical protein
LKLADLQINAIYAQLVRILSMFERMASMVEDQLDRGSLQTLKRRKRRLAKLNLLAA